MSAVQTLPHWDMDVVYSGLDSPEFQDDFEGLGARIDRLGQAFDHHASLKHEDVPGDAAAVEAFESIVRDYGDVRERLQSLYGNDAALLTEERDGRYTARIEMPREEAQ